MEVRIIKYDTFETVGFIVTENERDLFSWGQYPNEYFWVKRFFTSNSDIIHKVANLISLKSQLSTYENFISDFFEVSKENKEIFSDDYNNGLRGVKFAHIDKKIECIKSSMNLIINSIV